MYREAILTAPRFSKMFQGLSPVLLYLMMGFGAICAFAGLAMMFRPTRAEGEPRLELLGMKFNASSGGVIVFLIGAMFLAAPAVVPERRTPAGSAAATTSSGRSSVASVEPAELPVRKRADGREQEPNDSFDTGNRMSVGGSAQGLVERGDEDWFILPLDPDKSVLSLGIRTNAGACTMEVFSSSEKKLGYIQNTQSNTMESDEFQIGGFPAVIIGMTPITSSCSYEIFTSYS